MSGRCIAARAMTRMSEADETWPGTSRPSGRMKRVSVRPSSRALRFMSATKRPTSPRRHAGRRAYAASFALWISAAARRSRIGSRSPGWRRIDDSPTRAAIGRTVTSSPGRACSSATSAVISFVMLAKARRWSTFLRRITSPVAAFATRKTGASTSGGASRRLPRGRGGAPRQSRGGARDGAARGTSLPRPTIVAVSRLEPSRKPVKRSGVERSLEVQLGPLGGFDVRPTRLFVWGGDERKGHERIVSFGSPPQSLSSARRERELEARACASARWETRS